MTGVPHAAEQACGRCGELLVSLEFASRGVIGARRPDAGRYFPIGTVLTVWPAPDGSRSAVRGAYTGAEPCSTP